MINMKNIFKSLLMVLSGAMLFASCQEEAAPLASAISVDKQELTFAGASAEAQKVKVKAEGEWFVLSSEEWVTVKPAYGNGETEVTVTVADNVDSYNELAGPRSTVLNFCYGTTGVTPVTVKQLGENGLDASRTYSLVTKQEDIVAGSYLIVFNNAGKHIAMEPLTPSKTYGYLNAVDVTPKDGVITMPNGAYAFSLEAAETGYNMIMSDNRYIFMTGGYNSFNVSASKADANPWTFTLNEDGTVNIAAVTHNNYIQYSTGYSSAGAYTSPQDGGLLPYLYKDSKAKSDEVLSVKGVTVSPRATEATIKVTSNKTWKVRNHDEWIKSFTPAGEGNGEIKVTFDEYTSTTADRTASFMILGETTNLVIELTQLMVPAKSTIDELGLGKYCGTEGIVVAAGNDGGYVLADETSVVFVYQKNHGRVVGDKLYVEGNVLRSSGYNTNPIQITPMYTEELSKNNAWTYNPKTLDGAALDALVGNDASCEEVLVKGKLSVSGKYVNLAVNGAEKQGSIKYMLAADYSDLHGAHVVVKGYTVGTYNYLNILPYSVEIDPDVVVEPVDVTIAEFKALKNTTKYDFFRVTGTIKSISENDITIQAGSDELLISDIKDAPATLVVGDILTVVGNWGAEAMVNGKYESHRNAPELTIATTATVPATATSYTLEILSNVAWTAEASAGVTLDKTSGTGNASVVLTFAENKAYEPVTYTVTVTSELGDKVFTLTQEAAVPAFVPGSYWIVSGESVAKPLSSNYGAMECEAVWTSPSSYASTEANVFTFEAVDGGFTIKDSKGKYLYSNKSSSGWYTTFNVAATLPETGGVWTVEKGTDGLYVIKNTASMQFIQYNTSKSAFEHYENAKSGSLKPILVKAETMMPALTFATSLSFAAEGESKTITLPEGVTVVPTIDNTAFTTTVSANVVTVTAAAATETQTGALSLAISYSGFTVVKNVTLTQKVAVAGEVTATITFDNISKRTSKTSTQAVWEEEGITVVNDKSSSTTAIADYVKPARFYQNSKLTIEVDGMISSIVFDCNNASYATAMKNSIGSAATVASDKVTVILDSPAASYVVAKLSAQVRVDAITVTYVKN